MKDRFWGSTILGRSTFEPLVSNVQTAVFRAPKAKCLYARMILSTVVWLPPIMSPVDGGMSVDGRGVEGSVKICMGRGAEKHIFLERGWSLLTGGRVGYRAR